jgi:hypothetical protein
VHTNVAGMACALVVLVGCGSEEHTKAAQDGVASGDDGIGVMDLSGISLPDDPALPGDDSLSADDVWLMIRSFEPNACGMLDVHDALNGAPQFTWAITMLLPRDRIAVGEVFHFGGNDCTDDCVPGLAETYGGQGGPGGPWRGSGYRCGDDTYDQPSSAKIVALEDNGDIVIEIEDLCLVDYGPIQADMKDDPSDDVTYTADGRYRISLCPAPPPAARAQ